MIVVHTSAPTDSQCLLPASDSVFTCANCVSSLGICFQTAAPTVAEEGTLQTILFLILCCTFTSNRMCLKHIGAFLGECLLLLKCSFFRQSLEQPPFRLKGPQVSVSHLAVGPSLWRHVKLRVEESYWLCFIVMLLVRSVACMHRCACKDKHCNQMSRPIYHHSVHFILAFCRYPT